jgi:glutamate-1-semialdehyde aminotransferase
LEAISNEFSGPYYLLDVNGDYVLDVDGNRIVDNS